MISASTAALAASPTEALFREHAGAVLRWARALGGPAVDADEVVQEVFLVAHQGLARFRGDSSAKTWLYGITVNVVRGHRRRGWWRAFLGGTPEETAGRLPSAGVGPADAAQASESRRQVYEVLAQMSERYRNALILFELEDHSAEEIADLTGAKVGTVWVWLHRARADFLKRLQQLEQEGGDR